MEGGGLTEQDSVLRPASFREPDLDISDDKATVPSGMLFFSSKSHKQNQNKHIDSAQAQSRPGRFDAKSLGSPNFERNTTPRTEMGGSGEARYTDFMLGHLDRLNNFFEQGEESQRKGNGGGEGEGEGMEGSDTQSQQSSEDSEYRGEELGDDEESTSPVIAINTSSLGPGETTTVDGITYNSRGYEVCGQLNQHSKPCQRIGRCPFHGGKITPPPAGKPRRHAVKKSPYKQGWTKEEHLRFLSGLQIHGKGAWKEIANIVGTRTPTQIQSHAQKYYLRQKQEVKNKRSIHDVSLSDLIKEDPAALEGGASPRKSDPGNKSQWSINNSRTKGRRGGGNLPYTSHMLLQPAASPLHFPSAQDAASSMGSLSQHSPSSSPSPSPTPALSGNSSPTPDPKAAMMGRYSPQLPLHPQHMHQRASSPYGMAAPPARVSSPMSFHPSNPGTFRPQPLSSYSPSTMRHQQQQQQHQQHTMQPLHTASPTGDLVPSSNPPYMGPPGSNINNKNAGNGSPSGGYTSAMPPPGSNNGSSDQSNSNLLLAPMTTAFTPFIRPGRIGESNGGGYIFPHPSHRGSPEGNSVHGSTSNHDGTTNDNGADGGGGGGEGKNHINGDMVELEIEMLRNRTRRLATPPPNTFQPIIAFHGGDPINVAHLLRPVHSPVPQIPPSSRLPPMSSTPPPSLMIQPPSQQQQQQQQQQSPSSGMGVFPSSPSSGLTRSNLLSGNPYTSTGSSSQQSSFSLLNIPDGPNALPSSPFSSSSLLSPNSALPASSATSPQPFSLPTSPGLEGLKTESLSGSPKSDIHNLTTNGSMGFPLHYPPQPRDAISMQQPSNPGGEYLPHSVHSDFSPLMAASHPGRDSAEPVDDVQLLHPSAHGDEIREPSVHDQALTMQNFMRGTLAMLSGGAGSFSTPMNDDSEDEHVMGMEKEDAMPMPFSRKRRISDSASPFAHEGEASGHPRGTGDNGSGESDAKRAKGESTQGNAAPSAVTSDEHEEDTSSYFSSD